MLPSHPQKPLLLISCEQEKHKISHVIMCREPASFNTIYRKALNETTHKKKGGKPQATVEQHHNTLS